MREITERFLEYVRINTQSKQDQTCHPSSPGQTDLMHKVIEDLVRIGVIGEEIEILGDGSFLVHLPATRPQFETTPHVCFAAHLDTYFGCPGAAKPIIHCYDGGDIILPCDGVIIPASDLKGLAGRHIITSDGSTLLGGDDKAGVAALVTLIHDLLIHKTHHGNLTFWFCVDEEVSEVGVEFLPKKIAESWDIFWTVDGGEIDIIDVGCFCGAKVTVEFRGNDAHPGVSGQSLKPAHYAACRFVDKLNEVASPWNSCGDEPFIYVPAISAGTAGKTIVTVYPRTFNKEEVPDLAGVIRAVAEEAASRYGVTAVIGETDVMYISTEEAIKANPVLIQPALAALMMRDFAPKLHRVRAGTDGAMLNMAFPRLPAPNFGTGGRNLHGPREFVVQDELELLPEILIDMAESYACITEVAGFSHRK